jgi:RNA polymerase sigma-70 factor (ECF subfamily)
MNDHTFEEAVLPHLDAGRRLARWLVRNDDDAEDVVQEASLRAFRYFRTFTGGNARAWFLSIVRNSCHGWHGAGMRWPTDSFDEQQHSTGQVSADPETLLLRTDDAAIVEQALNSLPTRYRQALILRELEGLSYRELAETLHIPMGTVMSTLSRARHALRDVLINQRTDYGVLPGSIHETYDDRR